MALILQLEFSSNKSSKNRSREPDVLLDPTEDDGMLPVYSHQREQM